MIKVEVPNNPIKEPTAIPINSAVARSLAKPDAFAKPGTVGKHSAAPNTKVRVRLTNQRARGRPRTRKRDPRNVHFF
jgi:hypothetical protein